MYVSRLAVLYIQERVRETHASIIDAGAPMLLGPLFSSLGQLIAFVSFLPGLLIFNLLQTILFALIVAASKISACLLSADASGALICLDFW